MILENITSVTLIKPIHLSTPTIKNTGGANEFSSVGASSCKAATCSPGSHFDYNGNGCYTCAAGKYTTVLNAQPSCDECPAGTFQSNTGRSACTSCSAGKYGTSTASTSSSTCIPCNAGKFSASSASTTCTDCSAGEYRSQTGGTACDSCIQGGYSWSGQSVCTECETGKYGGSSNLSVCTDCSPGEYAAGTKNIVCDTCSFGKYGGTSGMSTCNDCPSGKYAPSSSLTVCIDCAAGLYQSIQGESSCSYCSSGKYGTFAGMSSCTDCVANYESYNPFTSCSACGVGYGSVAGSACQACGVGTYTAGGPGVGCSNCPAGKSSNTQSTSISACTDCGRGKYTDGSGGACTDCLSSYYQPDVGKSACIACPAGKYTSTNGALSCDQTCPGGKSTTPGTDVCFSCALGKTTGWDFAGTTYSTECFECGVGNYAKSKVYNQQVDYDNCEKCDIGKYSMMDGIDTLGCFSCGLGFYSSGGSTPCNACEPGKYQPVMEADIGGCIPCQPGSASLYGGTSFCDLCEQAFYSEKFGAVTCTQCGGGELTPGLGADSADMCVSPTTNFYTGFAVLFFIIPIAMEYIVHGRYHRIAFLRQERVTKVLVRDARELTTSLFHYTSKALAQRKRDLSMRALKTFLFLFFGMFLCFFVAIFAFVGSMSNVFFKSLILWRGLKIDLPFMDMMNSAVADLADFMGLDFVKYIFMPFELLFWAFSNLKIDLSAVNVTCKGASAPLELLINLIIMGVTIIIIESDYQYFRALTLNSVTDVFISAVTQPAYKSWAYRQRGKNKSKSTRGKLQYVSTLFLMLFARAIGGFDAFQSMLQYLMSLVSVTNFTEAGGIHAYSPECNNVTDYENFDLYLAVCASVEAYMLLMPAFYELSKVLVPGLPPQWEAIDKKWETKRDPKSSVIMHVVKYFGLISPDLFVAVMAEKWLRFMKRRLPHEVGKNSESVRGDD